MRRAACLLLACLAVSAQVPRTWNEKDLADWALPVAALGIRPGHYSEQEYYKAPADVFLRTYPVYHPDREPAGYWESLARGGPQALIEPSKIRSEADWLRAGRRVFEELDVPGFRNANPKLIARIRSREEVAKSGAYVRKDGTLPPFRWIPTARGVELGISDCSGCHTRDMPDGTVLHGAPFNVDGGPMVGEVVEEGLVHTFFPGDSPLATLYRQFGTPWLKPDPHERLKTMEGPEVGEMFRSHIVGVFARFSGSPFYLTKVPDLIGFRERKYIDHTATHRHRNIGDLMRYGALVSCCDSSEFGAYRLLSDEQRRLPYRFPDEVLYALGQYIYSLQPPPNPNRWDEKAAAGKAIFESQGCAACHTPPLYTNNRLTPAAGFKPPKEHYKMFDVLDVPVGTDPSLALKTRKGTGYYKVPSLKGVWYRGLYLHDGAVASLDDLFDPARLREDYAPSGFKGHRVKQRAVPGHEFGLLLKPEERANLIAFLRTL